MITRLRAWGLALARQAQQFQGALRSACAGVTHPRARCCPNAESHEHSSSLPAARPADDLGEGGVDTFQRSDVSAPSLVGDAPELERLRSEVARLTARVDELEIELAFAQARTTALQREDWEQRLAAGGIPSRRALINVLRLVARAHGMQGGGGPLHWS